MTIATLPTVNFTNTEGVTINGQGGGDALTVTTLAGADTATLTPGASVDSGLVTITSTLAPNAVPPLSFLNLGAPATATVTFADASGGRADTLVYNGTVASDVFNVSATGTVTLNSQVPVLTPGVVNLQLLGQDGDDTFNVAGGRSSSQYLA